MTVLDWLAPTDKPFRKGMMLASTPGTHACTSIDRFSKRSR